MTATGKAACKCGKPDCRFAFGPSVLIDKDGGFIVPQRMEHLVPKRVVRADGVEWLGDWFVAHCRHVQRTTHMRQSRQRLRAFVAPSPGKQV